ncbi:MAG: hypothetical protein ABI581_04050 [Sediminibacterium sp.]
MPLYKRIPYQQNDAVHIWRDGFGNAVLSRETNNTRQLYRFYSHFDPSWNDLTWNTSFPKLIYALIDPSVLKETVNSFDRRSIGETQIQLKTITNKNSVGAQDADSTKARQLLWLIVFILFFVERFFSFKPQKEKVNA